MAQKRRNQKVKRIKRYRKPLNLNIGMVIFAAVLVYVIYCVMNYLRSDPPRPYEVTEGSLSTNLTYRGIALRNEQVVTAQTSGYLSYYAREGERVAKGDVVYTIDETGQFKEYQESISLGENTLSKQQLMEFRSEIVNFVHGFSPQNFSSAYNFKYELSSTVLRLANANMLKDLNSAGDYAGNFQTCRAPDTGIVAYWMDGYESLTPEQVTMDILDEKAYGKTQLADIELAAVSDPIYKLAQNEEWNLVIPVEAEEGAMLEKEGYVRVRFQKNQYESWASTKMLVGPDGGHYVQLGFNNSMVTFISERFLEVELLLNQQVGLKIPLSSIARRNFFLVPETFITQSGTNASNGVLRRTYLEDGTPSTEYVETDLYSYDEETGDYYIDTDVLGMGDVLLMPDSQATYTVSRMETLIGVYNMNKGYADFREINILAQNDEYAIVASNTRYGLNVYDNIVLDASTVTDAQLIYE